MNIMIIVDVAKDDVAKDDVEVDNAEDDEVKGRRRCQG